MAWTTPKTWTTGDLVTATDLNTHVRDNMNVLFAPTNYQEAVGSGTDFTTTSMSFVDITGMSANITTTGGNLLVVGIGRLYTNDSTREATLAINVDGTDYEVGGSSQFDSSSGVSVVAFRRFVVSAGAHVVKFRMKTLSGVSAASFAGGTRRRLIAVEGVL